MSDSASGPRGNGQRGSTPRRPSTMSPTPAFRSTALRKLAFALSIAAFAGPDVARSAGIGLSPVRAQRFANEDLFLFIPEEGDRFAWSLAVGDFNGDGADDLASGMPYDDGF